MNKQIAILCAMIVSCYASELSAVDVMSWVPAYNREVSQGMAQSKYGDYGPVDGLTRLGLQWWTVSETGDVHLITQHGKITKAEIKWYVDWGNEHDIKTMLSITNEVNGQWDWALAQEAFGPNRKTLVRDLVGTVKRHELDGIDIDFQGTQEELDTGRAEFREFIELLSIKLKSNGLILTVNSSHKLSGNQPNLSWIEDWAGMVDGVHSMGFENIFEGNPKKINGHVGFYTYSEQQNYGLEAGFLPHEFFMAMPGDLDEWGYRGRGSAVLDHIEECMFDVPRLAPIAIWSLEYLAPEWQTEEVWATLAELRGVDSVGETVDADEDTIASVEEPQEVAEEPQEVVEETVPVVVPMTKAEKRAARNAAKTSNNTKGLIPDEPITPAQAVSMLQEGLVKEFSREKLIDNTPFIVEQVKAIKKAGYHHIRFRHHWTDYSKGLPLDQPYPPERFDGLERAIDAALAEGLGVILAFRGAGPMEEGHHKEAPGELTQRYLRFWKEIATRFQHKSHRLFFNLFIEPGALGGNSPIVFPLLTKEIRKNNPTRMIVYFKCPGPAPVKGQKKDPSQRGRDYYANSVNVAPKEAGIYYIWDYHILKGDLTANRWKVKQAYDFQQEVKQVMWSGAWSRNAGEKEEWMNLANANGVARAMREYGMSSAILCCLGSTFPIKGEETSPLNTALTQGSSIWWNLVDNPGFDQETQYWTSNGGEVSTTGGIEESPYMLLAAGESVTQDITLALKNNGTGIYDVLGSFYAERNHKPQIQIKVTTKNGSEQFSASIPKLTANKWSDVHSTIDVTWNGTLKKAELIITAGSTTTGVDKLGLTQFYRQPVLDRTVWPGEVDRAYNAPSKSNDGGNLMLDIAYDLLALAGNEFFIDGFEKIKEYQEEIDKIAVAIFPQYKPDGVNIESLQLQVANKLNKNSKAEILKAEIAAIKMTFRDWVLMNDKRKREKFIKKYDRLPPSLDGKESEFKDELPIENLEEVKKKWKEMRQAEKLRANNEGERYSIKEFVISDTKITGKKVNGKTYTFNITKDTEFLDFDGNPTTLDKIDLYSYVVGVRFDPNDQEDQRVALIIQDETIISAKDLEKAIKKGKENQPVNRIWVYE